MAIVSMLYGAGGASSAEEVSYDNTTSGLEADNVQDAIDEVNSKGVIYSDTVEQVVGRWQVGGIDRPIYKKVFKFDSSMNVPDSSGFGRVLEVNDMELMLSATGFTAGATLDFTIPFYSNDGERARVFFEPPLHYLRVYIGSDPSNFYKNADWYLIVEYLKVGD